jgi:hypothetical protein
MTEGAPRPERGPLTKEEVVAKLKESPEDLTPYLAWLETRENQVERSDDPREGLRLMVAGAEILRDAGIIQGARMAYEDAAM